MKSKKILGILVISLVSMSACISNNSSSSLFGSSSYNSSSILIENNKYKVTWIVGDQTSFEIYEEGETPKYKFGVNRPADNTFSYTFIGWDKTIVPVTGDVTYTAEYSKEYIDYTYTWVIDGEEIEENYHYGETPTYKEDTPEKASDDQYNYTFTGWDKELDAVDGDERLVAQFDREVRTYEVKFVVDGQEYSDTYYYGEIPEYHGSTEKEPDNDYIYTFTGWDKNITPVSGNTTYTALFNQSPNAFTINFYDAEGSLLSKELLKLGDVPSFEGTVPNIVDDNNNSYEFDGWLNRKTNSVYEDELPEVSESVDYYAYSKEVNILNVNHYKLDGELISSQIKKINYDEVYTVEAIDVAGLVPNLDYVKGGFDYYSNISFYYSELDTWNTTAVSNSLSGNGTEDEPYLISSGADLAYLQNQVTSGNVFSNQYFKLTKSINVNNHNLNINEFDGKFEGNNCSIRGINISRTAANTGLFNNLGSYGEIKNLAIYGNVKGVGCTGAIAGVSDGLIKNCTSYVTITGNGQRGGLVGKSTSIIENCVNYGDSNVNASGWVVGGIVGESLGNVINCVNFGNVKGMSTDVAGICGTTTANIINCKNYGNISGATWGAAGVVSGIGTATSLIDGCKNYGNVLAIGQVGGIVAKGNGTIVNCYNNGEITATQLAVGGIVGDLKCEISYCVNEGKIVNVGTGSSADNGSRVGGIAGTADVGAKISYCENYGEISGKTKEIGGIVGMYSSANELTKCINRGNINGVNYIGGIAGKVWVSNGTASISYCDNYGEVNSTSYIIGGVFGSIDKGVATECNNYGKVTTTRDGVVGGVSGAVYASGKLVDCKNYGEITAPNKVAGIVGENQGIVTNCDNYGKIVVTTTSGIKSGTIAVNNNSNGTTDCDDFYSEN